MSSNNQKVSTTERVIKSEFNSFYITKILHVSSVSMYDISMCNFFWSLINGSLAGIQFWSTYIYGDIFLLDRNQNVLMG